MASDVLTALHERNRASAAACCTARMHETLLQDYNALEKTAMQCERLQQEADTANAAAVKAAVDASDPVADTRGPVDFKKYVAGVIVKKAIESARSRA